jgi:glucose-1-phosphate cytidylyltransferase
LGNVDLHALLRFHKESGGLATVTSVPLRSQYGTILFDDGRQVTRFVEKPVIKDYWINAGFFVFNKAVFESWEGQNLEQEVLPKLAGRGELFTYLHHGFWKSMDTVKDQQEMEAAHNSGQIPWMHVEKTNGVIQPSHTFTAVAAD